MIDIILIRNKYFVTWQDRNLKNRKEVDRKKYGIKREEANKLFKKGKKNGNFTWCLPYYLLGKTITEKFKLKEKERRKEKKYEKEKWSFTWCGLMAPTGSEKSK